MASFGTVSIEQGSLPAKFRSYGQIEEIKVNLRKLWKIIKKNKDAIVNSFNHLAEYSIEIKEKYANVISHIGIYAAALALVFISLWHSVAFQVISGLSTLGQNLLNHLRAAWPIINLILFIICSIYRVMEGPKKLNDAIVAAKKFYSD